MNKFVAIAFLSIIGLCFISIVTAFENKTEEFFMRDDGVFSDSEKDEEAKFVEQQCGRSVLEQQYYNCSCIASSLRLKRGEGNMDPQDWILHDLYNDRNSKCVDSDKISDGSYQFCVIYSASFRTDETAESNESYCQCVANKVVQGFSKEPRLKSNFINDLKVQAMGACDTRH